MPLWLYLHFPQLQLDSLFSQQGFSSPVVILSTLTNQVLQLNAYAKKAGINVGMSLGSAAALAHALQVIPHQPYIEENKLEELANSLYLVTSDICLTPPNGITLRIHPMLSLYGGIDTYWIKIQQHLKTHHVHFHYATGFSPLSAQILAQIQWDTVTQDKQIITKKLCQCDLQHTELDKKHIHKLARVGIRKLAQLLTVPHKELAKRFDKDVAHYLIQLTGEYKHAMRFYHPKEQFGHYLELTYEISQTQTLHHPLTRLLTSLERFLKIHDWITQQIAITLYQRDSPSITLEVGSQQGEYLAKKWLALTDLKLESVKLQSPVYGIRLCAHQTHINTPDSPHFFSNKQSSITPLQLISILQAKLSEKRVHHLTLENDYRPDVCSRYTPHLPGPTSYTPTFPMRPSFLLLQPIPLQEDMTIILGPERLNTGWWDNHHITRDYFVARNQQGQCYWLFKNINSEWFIHGVYG